jgi:NDP-sugar pyrophosphorylase family protein
MLRDQLSSRFIVSNCDIIVEQDYSELVKYHEENGNELTVVGVVKGISIPYGTLTTLNEGILSEINEKPEINFMINSGVYVLEPWLIKEIPAGTIYHLTDLIQKLLYESRRVGVFPVSERSWIDIGEWRQYFEQMKIKI